jgi:CRISPR system Cascade subunit CasD
VKTLLLRLEGPMQSWATQSRFGVRDTEREPSKSGVLGLVGAALGMARDDDERLAELRGLEFGVRVDRPGTLLRDYQTAGGSTFRGEAYYVHGASKKNSVLSERYYLQNASFLAALRGEDELADEVAAALRNPHWPLFLGRKSCPPSRPVFVRTVAAKIRDALIAEPWEDEEGLSDGTAPTRLILESNSLEGEPRYDVPISFAPGAIEYGVRYVRTTPFDSAEAPS